MYELDVNRKPTTRPDDRRETTGRLLDTAEKLFSMGVLFPLSAHLGRSRAAAKPKLIEGILQELVRFVSAGLRSAPAIAAESRPPLPHPLHRPRACNQ